MRLGIKLFKGDILLYIDADGSHDPNDIPAMVEPIKNGTADMVIGSRFKGGSDELVGTINQLFRITGSNIITTYINYRWNVRLTDTQNGFRALSRAAAEESRSKNRWVSNRNRNGHSTASKAFSHL